VSGFTEDRRSGSADVARGFLDALERWAAVDTTTKPNAFRESLLGFLRMAQAAQPSMALVHQFAWRALEVADTGIKRGDALPAIRASLDASCKAEREDLAAAQTALARQALELLDTRHAWIATLSASGTVVEALVEAQRAGRAPRALVAEGRPHLEGRATATALAAAGIPVWLVADAALPLLLSQARMVWIGADAVTETGVLNKIGSFAAALAAREHSVPVYALAPRRKFLSARNKALKILEMPPTELWESPSPGVEPRNVYFESVPLPLLRAVVVEDGVLPPGETAEVARDRELPSELNTA
jgi:translation initiation factor 2B subunit (eIF-2B alpha/beta/delta family)